MKTAIKRVLATLGVFVLIIAITFTTIGINQTINNKQSELSELTSSLTFYSGKTEDISTSEMGVILGSSDMVVINGINQSISGVLAKGNEVVLMSTYYRNSVVGGKVKIEIFNIDYYNYDKGIHAELRLEGGNFGTKVDYTPAELADLIEKITISNYKKVLDHYDVRND